MPKCKITIQQEQSPSLHFLTKNSQVEITSSPSSPSSPWYTATVIHPPPPNHHLVYVEYHHLFNESSTPLREYANVSLVRPSPAPENTEEGEGGVGFGVNDVVDAFYKDGWWTGVISEVVDELRFVVRLRKVDEQIEFSCNELRVHRRWDGCRWLQPQKQGTAVLMFTTGKKVEVSFETESLHDCWFPATILKNSDNNTFLVEYQKPGTGDEAILHKVTVDYHHIRPSPPPLKDKNFVLLEKVDAYYDFGWWSGVITKELPDNRYNVFFEHTKEDREFVCSNLRPHIEWKGGKWFNASQGDTATHSLIEQIKQTSSSIDKQSTVATSTMNKSSQEDFDSNDNGSLASKKPEDETMNDGSTEKTNSSSVTEINTQRLSVTPLTVANKAGSVEDASSVAPKRKRGRPPKLKKKGRPPGTSGNENATVVPSADSMGEGGENEEVGLTTSIATNSLEENQEPVNEQTEVQNASLSEDKLASENTEKDLDVQVGQGGKKYSAKNGRRVKRKTISINTEPPAQESQDTSKEKTDENLEKDSATITPEPEQAPAQDSQDAFKENTDESLENDSATRTPEAKDAPVTTVHGPEGTAEQSSEVSESLVTCDTDPDNLPFVRSTTLWRTIESMEAFQMFPQKPHFRPLLEGVNEGAREGLAIGTMVTFSTIVDKTRHLRSNDSRSTIEDCLKTLVQLENNGFDVEMIKERLTQLLMIKNKQDELAARSKQIDENIEEHNVQVNGGYEEIEAIDRHIRELEEKRKQVMLKKEKWGLEIGVVEAMIEELEQELRRVDAEFDRLAAAPL